MGKDETFAFCMLRRIVNFPQEMGNAALELLTVSLFIQKISYEIALAVDQSENFNLTGKDFINKPI